MPGFWNRGGWYSSGPQGMGAGGQSVYAPPAGFEDITGLTEDKLLGAFGDDSADEIASLREKGLGVFDTLLERSKRPVEEGLAPLFMQAKAQTQAGAGAAMSDLPPRSRSGIEYDARTRYEPVSRARQAARVRRRAAVSDR